VAVELTHGPRGLPDATVVEVGGLRTYEREGEIWLSTSTVLSLSPWGNLAHIPPAALEWGATRGTYVHDACELDDQGLLDFDALDDRLKGYVLGWRSVRHLLRAGITEELRVQQALRTFGWADRIGIWGSGGDDNPAVVDIKTSKYPSARHALQLASYARPGEIGVIVYLSPKGNPDVVIYEDMPLWYARFRALAFEAHSWVEEERRR
jgi:hypothetical protein